MSSECTQSSGQPSATRRYSRLQICATSMSQPTPKQLEAVRAGGNLLIVAGAGTGKTRTLVARCLRLVLEENVSLENILMVTFTEAAAAEMRARIREALRELQTARPEDERLAQQ